MHGRLQLVGLDVSCDLAKLSHTAALLTVSLIYCLLDLEFLSHHYYEGAWDLMRSQGTGNAQYLLTS